jgi:ribonucleotide monophosphatase NagD (HAD superfamily)
VGDRLETDIQMGINASIESALVLTGATNLDQAKRSEIKPTYIINSVSNLLPDGIV